MANEIAKELQNQIKQFDNDSKYIRYPKYHNPTCSRWWLTEGCSLFIGRRTCGGHQLHLGFCFTW